MIKRKKAAKKKKKSLKKSSTKRKSSSVESKKAVSPKHKRAAKQKLSKNKFGQMRQTIILFLWRLQPVTPELLRSEVNLVVQFLPDHEFERYYKQAIKHLTKKKLIEPDPEKKILHVRLVQKVKNPAKKYLP